jgi:glycosyltransferase involved in cell wall biosynthesis
MDRKRGLGIPVGVKVALLCNMNNIMFALARYLRDRGFEADLFLFDDEHAHFHPSADSYSLEYQKFTTQLMWGKPLGISKVTKKDLLSVLDPYPKLLGCGAAPAYVDKADRILDIFVPYGGDLFELPFRIQGVSRRTPQASLEVLFRQRRGIRNSRAILIDQSVEYTEAISRLRATGKQVTVGLPFPYTPEYAPETIAAHYNQTHWYQDLRALRERSDVMVVHHARHIWGDAFGARQAKGNDKLLRGFKQAQEARPNVRYTLVMCEYGPEISRSKQLVHELGLESAVLWLPQTQRKELMVALNLADIGCGEFSVSWLTGGTINETLAMGKPLLHYRNDALYTQHFPELYPLMNAYSQGEICSHLVDYADRPEHYKTMGAKGRAWHATYAIEEPLRAIAALLK